MAVMVRPASTPYDPSANTKHAAPASPESNLQVIVSCGAAEEVAVPAHVTDSVLMRHGPVPSESMVLEVHPHAASAMRGSSNVNKTSHLNCMNRTPYCNSRKFGLMWCRPQTRTCKSGKSRLRLLCGQDRSIRIKILCPAQSLRHH